MSVPPSDALPFLGSKRLEEVNHPAEVDPLPIFVVGAGRPLGPGGEDPVEVLVLRDDITGGLQREGQQLISAPVAVELRFGERYAAP